MNPDMLIIGSIVLPIALLTFLRVNAAIIFLSLCLGAVLVQFAGSDAASLVNMFSSSQATTNVAAELGLLWLPAVFTMVVMIGTVRGHARILFNLLPAAAVGVVGLLLAEPLFTPGLRGAIAGTQIWHSLQQLQVLAVTASTIVSLLFLWLQRPGRESGKHGRHH
jgi:hypothetical protein